MQSKQYSTVSAARTATQLQPYRLELEIKLNNPKNFKDGNPKKCQKKAL